MTNLYREGKMKKVLPMLYLTTASLLAACGGGGGGSPAPAVPKVLPNVIFNDSVTRSAATDQLGYEPGNRRHEGGELQTNTGIWGINSATAYTINMSGTINPNTNVADVDVLWDITPSATPGVVNFSNITFGLHPGEAKSTTSRMPVKVSEMGSFIVSGDVKTTCLTVCSYNTMIDAFVMASNRVSNQDIGTEIVVATETNFGFPKPVPDGVVNFAGRTFNVYHNAFGSTWNTIQYLDANNDPINAVAIDMKDFVGDALARGWISPSDYFVSIEFGSEVGKGVGKTEIKNYKIIN